jgi:hypothetical protein
LKKFTPVIETELLTKRRLNNKQKMLVKLPNGVEVEIIVFYSKNDALLGQSTFDRKIIVHEICLKNTNLLHYVVAHEYGHHKSWLNYCFAFLAVTLWTIGLLGFLGGLLYFSKTLIIVSLTMILFGSTLSWIIEYMADSTALNILGIDNIMSAQIYLKTTPKSPLLWKILGIMTHPPFSLNLKLYRFLNKHHR